MKRLMSVLLAAVMVMSLIPMAVFAETTSTLEVSGLESYDILVGSAVEFTVTSVAASEDEGTTVVCRYEILADETDIEKLEYYETATGMEGWHEFPSKLSGSFGPDSGFPYTNGATSKFRVTFAKPGDYSVVLSAVAVAGETVLCSKNVDVKVIDYADYTELNATISTAEKCVSDKDKYTKATIANVEKALITAKTVVAAKYTEKNQETVNEAYDGLKAAVDALVLLADTTDIEALVLTGTAKVETEYTKASWAAFKTALDAASKLLDNELSEDDQADVEAAKNTLEAAMKALKKVADTTALKAKVDAADVLDAASYSNATFNAMKEKLDAAKVLLAEDLNYTDDQARVDSALNELTAAVNSLKKLVAVSVSATAVASDVTAEYGKADTIVLVFGTALDCNASDVLDALSVASEVESAEWADTYKTVLKLTLAHDHTLTNGTVIAIRESDAVVDANGCVVSGMTVAVVGNLEDVADKITADAMTATIVKGADKPGVHTGDTIVLVFNAPVKDAPDEIDVTSDASSTVMKAAKDDTTATVYVIGNIDAALTDSSKLTFGDISAVNLLGSFGTAIAPVVIRMLAVERSNNALAENDEIVIYFSRPTNGVTITTDVLESVLGIADAVAAWSENNTVLTLTLGNGSVVTNGMTLNLDGLGIMDEHETVAYAACDLTLEGAFITSSAPVVKRILIVDNDGTAKTEGDNIIISFDTPINDIDLSTDNMKKIVAKAGQGLGDDFAVAMNDAKTEITITVGKTATLDDSVLFNLKDIGIKDKDGLHSYVGTVITPEGSFGTSVAPKITRAIAFTQGTKHIIRVFFNTEIVVKGAMSVSIDNGFNVGTSFSEKWTNNGITYYDLFLGDDHSEFVTGVNTITFNGIVADKESGKTSDDVSAIIDGGFEQDIEPQVLSLTAYSADGSGVAKKGDKLVLVLNSVVTKLHSDYAFTSDDNVTYIYTLEKDREISVGDEIPFDIEAQGKAYTLKATVAGSFGYKVEPKLLSAVAYSKDGSGVAKKGDEIVLTFNAPVSGVTSSLGTVTTTDNINFSILLSENGSVSVGEKIKFNVTSIATGEEYSFEVNLAGSFGKEIEPKLTSITAYSKDGSGVAKKGDTVIVIFNTPVSGVETELGEVTTNDNVVWTVTLKDGNVKIGDRIEFAVYSIATGKSYDLSSSIKGSFGFVVEPELISATAYSKDGSGVAKNGDEIVLVFNSPVNVTSTYGDAKTTDNTVWTITINKTDIKIGDTLSFPVESIANGTVKNCSVALGGSFGKIVEPKALNITAISEDGSGIAKVGDTIAVVFNTVVTVTKINGDFVTESTGNVYKYTLKTDGEFKVGDPFVLTVVDPSNGIEYTLDTAEDKTTVGGSFGYSEEPSVKSVVIAENSGTETIRVVFDRATNHAAVDTSVLYENNKHLGVPLLAVWESETVLKITLAANATTTDADTLNLSGLGIKALDTGAEITGLEGLAITGTLIPVVESVNAVDKKITITFSARTNGVANISNLVTLLGTGSKAEWSENNKVLTITLGESYTITNNGYIVLNGMGIKDGFSGAHHVVGQYKVSGSIETDTLALTKIVAQSTNKSKKTAQKGDTIVVKFNSATNLNGAELNTLIESDGVDAIVSVEGGNEAVFGTGYTGEWTAYDTFVITLGGKTTAKGEERAENIVTGNDPTVTVGTEITVSGVAFANGEGTVVPTTLALGGSFNGREFVITDGKIERTGSGKNGDYRISMKVESTLLNTAVKPTVVCVAYNGTSVVSVTRITIDILDEVVPAFELSGKLDVTSAKIYVFSDAFANITASPEVLAEPVVIK